MDALEIEIKRIDKDLPLPVYQTSGSVAFDLYPREDAVIQPHQIKLVPANFIVKTPPGYFLLVAGRSSLPMKKGLMLANGIGVVDQDYCGEKDELKLQLINFTGKPIEVKRGERLAQAIFVKIAKADLKEVEAVSEQSRGGFGSTG